MKKAFALLMMIFLFGLLVQTSGCSLFGNKGKMPVTEVANQVKTDAEEQLTEIDARNEYYSSVMSQKMILSEAFFQLDTLIKNPKPNDASWSFQVDALLVKIQKVIENKYGKICPAIYNDANIEYSKALDSFQYFVKNYPKAIENMNSELLSTCSEKLKEGYQSIGAAAEVLNQKNNLGEPTREGIKL